MKPAARITLNGKDVTAEWDRILESVSVTDEAGGRADTCELSFDNRDGFSAPPTGAELQVWIGYEPQPAYRGRFKIDAWTKSFPRRRLTISAKAADFTSGIRTPRMRSYHETTVGQIVGEIAARHGLKPVVDASIGAHAVEHIDQQTESDAGFLSRLAKRHGATFKMADGKVIFAAKGASTLPDGSSKTAITIRPAQISSLEATSEKRGDYKAASTHYMDHATGKRKTASAGSGSPIHRDRRLYGSKAEAEAAANANLGDLKRGLVSISLEGPGDPALFAEAAVALNGFDSDVDGGYIAKSVTHRFDGRGGYTMSATLEIEGVESD